MNDATLLQRHFNPAWTADGLIHTPAFTSTRKDAGLLSVYDGDMHDRTRSLLATFHLRSGLHIGRRGRRFRIRCGNQQLPVHPAPQPFPEYALIDFTGLSRSQIKRKAESLKAAATVPGWLFQPRV